MVRAERAHTRNIVVIGASAGGVQALQELMRGLPGDYNGVVLIVMHTSRGSPGVLPRILERAGALPVDYAVDHEPIQMRHVYIAPPDYHLILRDSRIHVVHGPKENGFRPAVDPLFRTAARAMGPRVVGIILSGGLDDGTLGLGHIRASGGI